VWQTKRRTPPSRGDEPTRPDERRPGPSTPIGDGGSGPLPPSPPAEEPEPEVARSASNKVDGPAEATRSGPADGGSPDEAQGSKAGERAATRERGAEEGARRWKGRILLVGVAVVAVGVVAGWRVLGEGGAGRSPSQTVAA